MEVKTIVSILEVLYTRVTQVNFQVTGHSRVLNDDPGCVFWHAKRHTHTRLECNNKHSAVVGKKNYERKYE